MMWQALQGFVSWKPQLSNIDVHHCLILKLLYPHQHLCMYVQMYYVYMYVCMCLHVYSYPFLYLSNLADLSTMILLYP